MIQYQSGFGNEFSTEALPGALPVGQNTPQRCAYGLYAEQLSGAAFTVPRHSQQRTWLYRIRPSVLADIPFELFPHEHIQKETNFIHTPNQLRWDPLPVPDLDDGKVDFLQGWHTVAGSGKDAGSVTKHGISIHMYASNASMSDSAMYNSDGDLLIVPQTGILHIQTELGWLHVAPLEICVIPRGIKFAVHLPDGQSRGYILETYNGNHFELPDLGPIGANGLANPRDFLYPVASDDKTRSASMTLYNTYGSQLWKTSLSHSPFDVVAWHGNYSPYKYDLTKFNTINSVSFDHIDPSIFTVLTCKSTVPGVAIADFVIFPPRWSVSDHSFRPPYYHRNCMSEYMGNITGVYEAKEHGFLPGGGSLHSIMSAHGPDRDAFEKATQDPDLKPQRIAENCMSFMFESSLFLGVTPFALEHHTLQKNYPQVWAGLEYHFTE